MFDGQFFAGQAVQFEGQAFVERDPSRASVALLLHGDGADASTTFTDNSIHARTPTVVGNAQIDTAQSKFGGASMLFDGTGDYLSYADDTEWDFGTGNFTLEWWQKVNSWPTPGNASGIIARDSGTNFKMRIGQLASAGDYWLSLALGGTNHYSVAAGQAANDGGWHHCAFVRSGTTCYIFVDGTSRTFTGGGTSSYDVTLTAAMFIGHTPLAGEDYNGWLDDLRITGGVARYTANFTPRTRPFPNR